MPTTSYLTPSNAFHGADHLRDDEEQHNNNHNERTSSDADIERLFSCPLTTTAAPFSLGSWGTATQKQQPQQHGIPSGWSFLPTQTSSSWDDDSDSSDEECDSSDDEDEEDDEEVDGDGDNVYVPKKTSATDHDDDSSDTEPETDDSLEFRSSSSLALDIQQKLTWEERELTVKQVRTTTTIQVRRRVRFCNITDVCCFERLPREDWVRLYYSAHELQRMIDEQRRDNDTATGKE